MMRERIDLKHQMRLLEIYLHKHEDSRIIKIQEYMILNLWTQTFQARLYATLNKGYNPNNVVKQITSNICNFIQSRKPVLVLD